MDLKYLIIFSLVNFFDLAFGQDEPDVIWMPSPHFSSRNGTVPKWLVVHGTAGGSSAQGVGQWFQNPDSQAATHYIVGRDGVIVQCVRESEAAWGNRFIENGADPWWTNPIAETISIENVKPSTDNSDILSEEQKSALFDLIRKILSRWPTIKSAWADENGGITGHFSVSPESRARCPGPFPWEEMFAYLQNREPGPECLGLIKNIEGILNVHVRPDTSSAVQGTLKSDDEVNIVRFVNGVKVNGNPIYYHLWNGYLNSDNFPVLFLEPRPSWCY